jgi:hypothetical protein
MLLCVAGSPLAAQAPRGEDTARISGVVRDMTGSPVGGLHVALVGTNVETTTTDSGIFTFAALTPRTYTLVVHGANWLTAHVRVTATAGVETHVSVIVSPQTPFNASRSETLPIVTVQGEANRSTPAPSGVTVDKSGANTYTVTAHDIADLPAGDNTVMTDVLTQMPGVAIDQNQQIHIRDTEGPQFQYQINGALVPLDINTNPPFISMLNPMFVSRLDLLDGILPARYSYATGGVVDIETRSGCDAPGGQVGVLFGQRDMFEPSVSYAGCAGQTSYFLSGQYEQGETAFSSATPGPNPIHDRTNQGQFFGSVATPLTGTTTLRATVSTAASNNQLPNVPGLSPSFALAGATDPSSGAINSYLNFRDFLGMLSLTGTPSTALRYEVTYSAHAISQHFVPDNADELIYQGVASTASHDDVDNTLQGDVTYAVGHHTLGAGVYLGEYRVMADDRSLVFPVDSNGNQTSATPLAVINNAHATNIVSGVYVNDLWQIDPRVAINIGLRWDDLTGFTANNQFDPTINLVYRATSQTTVHAGFARYMQVPSFQGISPTASAVFAGTSAAGPPGISTPRTEDDDEWDAGAVYHPTQRVTLSDDVFYELTYRYLDTGQFGVVPIFAPFNYDHGSIWGNELGASYHDDQFSTYGNLTIGHNLEKGVLTGQFNFDPDELAFINAHSIVLDHQPMYGASAGASYHWHWLGASLDGIYSSGLRAGFADLEKLPTVVQINAGVQAQFHVPGLGLVTDRVTVLNLLDRVNLIRPAEGIGIFQSAYGPRFTVLDGISFGL